MTRETRHAVVRIAAYIIVFVQKPSWVVMFVAIDTRERSKVGLIRMALRTAAPLSLMGARIYREVIRIVIKVNRRPARSQVVTNSAIRTKSR